MSTMEMLRRFSAALLEATDLLRTVAVMIGSCASDRWPRPRSWAVSLSRYSSPVASCCSVRGREDVPEQHAALVWFRWSQEVSENTPCSCFVVGTGMWSFIELDLLAFFSEPCCHHTCPHTYLGCVLEQVAVVLPTAVVPVAGAEWQREGMDGGQALRQTGHILKKVS